ncbi:hypothetical protein AALO_G00210910 [Alosa alosa]|uniref:Uncharacterized protein n=1 Tax=Alosa alosa TaxID=278164 RepID=A0AAV6G2K2_9TELE|nr:hypothetical protein AALO_G00210910 [Alosa alosa]
MSLLIKLSNHQHHHQHTTFTNPDDYLIGTSNKLKSCHISLHLCKFGSCSNGPFQQAHHTPPSQRSSEGKGHNLNIIVCLGMVTISRLIA